MILQPHQDPAWVPRRPLNPTWRKVSDAPETWQRGTLVVTTGVHDIEGDGPTWAIGVSDTRSPGGRAGRDATRRALHDFRMEGAEEDNHGPLKFVRMFWLPIDPARRKPCPCKAAEEPEVSEAGPADDLDAYVWRPDLGGAR